MFFRYFLYITTNQNKTALYIGVTSDIQRRLAQHYADSLGRKLSFAGRYNCYFLLYYEGFESIHDAILREKEIKKWRREKKEILIRQFNPTWEFLNYQVF